MIVQNSRTNHSFSCPRRSEKRYEHEFLKPQSSTCAPIKCAVHMFVVQHNFELHCVYLIAISICQQLEIIWFGRYFTSCQHSFFFCLLSTIYCYYKAILIRYFLICNAAMATGTTLTKGKISIMFAWCGELFTFQAYENSIRANTAVHICPATGTGYFFFFAERIARGMTLA